MTFGGMKHQLYPLLFLLLTTCCARSQDSLQSHDTLRSGISHDSSIQATLVQGHKYPSLVYSANGQILSHREILARLQLYPGPADELQKYRNGRTGLLVCLGVMLGSGIAAAAEKDQRNSGAQYTFGGIAVAAAIGAFVSAAQSSLHFGRAIRVYNKRFVP
jgi:hypothetical protein